MSTEVIHQLLEQGQRSGLFTAAEARELLAQTTTDKPLTADEVAGLLVEGKALTPYQAERLLAGQADECLVAERYRILDKLGAGGMGTVYRAHDTQLDRDVAVKVLPVHRLQDADAVARFQREARALAKLSHPHIIQAYDSGEDKGRPFLVMEYVEGTSLADLLRQQGALPPTLAADLIYQAALGLQHAHEKGLVHRDLKPANLLLSCGQSPVDRPPAATDQTRPASEPTGSYCAPDVLGKGGVKILDLGLARFFRDHLDDGQLTQEGMGVGTPDYMAPEQFRDALHADARTDLYGLGCTLYHLIGGTVPFPGSSIREKAEAHAKREPIPLEERCPEVPAGLAVVVTKMMAKHPAERFQTAAEAAEALAPYVAGGSASMVRLRQSMRFDAGRLTLRPAARRKRLLRAAGGAFAAVFLLGLLALAWPSLFPPGPAEPPDEVPASGPPRTPVVTLENGLTVAKDGTGQFTTIGEAVAKAEAGMTVRVLDAATYKETVFLDEPDRHRGVTLEAAREATLELPDAATCCLQIENVPGVRVRGFRITETRGVVDNRLVTVRGDSSGVVLERLLVEDAANRLHGIVLEDVTSPEGAPPLVIRDCRVRVSYDGIKVVGREPAEGAGVSGRVLIHDNHIERALRGVMVVGAVRDVQVTGNLIRNCGQSGIQIENPTRTTRRILIANNSVMEAGACLRIWDDLPYAELAPGQVLLRNNLLLRAKQGDVQYYLFDGAKGLPTPGNASELMSKWRFDHNHRDLSGRLEHVESFTTPLAPGDERLREDGLVSLKPQDPDFLRPRTDTPLAKGGAGGGLPNYVGAVPPEGADRWDWVKTWEARVRTFAQEAGKPGED